MCRRQQWRNRWPLCHTCESNAPLTWNRRHAGLCLFPQQPSFSCPHRQKHFRLTGREIVFPYQQWVICKCMEIIVWAGQTKNHKKKNNNEVAGHLSAAWRKCKQSEFANTLKVNKRRWDIRVTITGQHFTVSKYEKRHTHSHDLKKSKRNNETERAWHEVWNLVKNTNTLTKEKHYSIHSNVVIRSGVWICSIMSCTVKTKAKMIEWQNNGRWMRRKMAAYNYLKATKYLWK